MLARRLVNNNLIRKQVVKNLTIQSLRPLTTNVEKTPQAPPPEKYGTFRDPPTSLGVKDPPVVDHNNWLQRKKQKLRDFTDYEKAFAAHAAERRYL